MRSYRSRSRSYSPRQRYSRSPPPRRPNRYDDARERYRGGGRDYRDYRGGRPPSAPSGLLVRNLPLDARPEDLRIPFEQFGAVKDVYLPKNYYTGEPRGFGFVNFRDADDAYEAKKHMNHQLIGGREITIVFAEENRKTPQEMRSTSRISGSRSMGGSRNRRRSPTPNRSPPSRRPRSYSRSVSPRRPDTREGVRDGRGDYSPSPRMSGSRRSPEENGRSPQGRSVSRSRSYSPAPQ